MKHALLVMLGLALVNTAVQAQEHEGGWFDLHNCAMCKNLSAEEGLLEHMTWENHIIPNGMMSIAVIPDDYQGAMDRVHHNMQAVVKKLQSGEQMPLCGFCQSYGKLMEMGAQEQEIKSAAGYISLLTSDDPQVVKKIHEHAQKTIDEHQKMTQS